MSTEAANAIIVPAIEQTKQASLLTKRHYATAAVAAGALVVCVVAPASATAAAVIAAAVAGVAIVGQLVLPKSPKPTPKSDDT